VVEGTFAEKKRKDFTAEDVRFTRSKDGESIFAILLGWPGNEATIEIRALGAGRGPEHIHRVILLGHEGELLTRRTEKGLEVTLPAQKPCEHAFALEIR